MNLISSSHRFNTCGHRISLMSESVRDLSLLSLLLNWADQDEDEQMSTFPNIEVRGKVQYSILQW